MDWLIEHWMEIAGVAAAFVLLFDRLAKLTPTLKDDQVVSTLYRLFAVLGIKVRDNPGAVPKPKRKSP